MIRLMHKQMQLRARRVVMVNNRTPEQFQYKAIGWIVNNRRQLQLSMKRVVVKEHLLGLTTAYSKTLDQLFGEIT
jgi:hypothetical protein